MLLGSGFRVKRKVFRVKGLGFRVVTVWFKD